jgi:hypothetical protein
VSGANPLGGGKVATAQPGWMHTQSLKILYQQAPNLDFRSPFVYNSSIVSSFKLYPFAAYIIL